jgi:hypothetical protein
VNKWLADLLDEYESAKPTQAQIGRLLAEFGDESEATMAEAVRQHIRTSPFWPKVADLMPHVTVARGTVQDDLHDYRRSLLMTQRGVDAAHDGDIEALRGIIGRFMEEGREYAARALQRRLEALEHAAS